MPSNAALPVLQGELTLSKVGADNLRALRMDQPIELRRLLLLVGRNGIGKSTFARLFPLLRQSTGSRTREPLLWWEKDQVDFGTFHQSLRRGSEEMTFTFAFTEPDGIQWQVKSVLCAGPQGSRVSRVELRQDAVQFSLSFDALGFFESLEGVVNGDRFEQHFESSEKLLPRLAAEPWSLFGVPSRLEGPTALLEMTKGLFHGNTDDFSRRQVVSRIPWESAEAIVPNLEHHNFGNKDRDQIAKLKKSPERIREIHRARFCWWALERLFDAEDLVEEVSSRTAYLGPFRAVPERGYRPQAIAVEEIDSRGTNLTMFLIALLPDERDDLNDYLERSLGFHVHTELNGGQYELQVELDGARYNVLDVGFGYSQVLPVAVQLWASGRVLSTSRTKTRLTTMVIEQPELHLHPHQQVLIARALGACAALDEGPVQIVETHSDHLVGEVGMLIARGQLPAERVGVLCIEPHPEGGARVRTATFNEEGVLQNWPTGFLSA